MSWLPKRDKLDSQQILVFDCVAAWDVNFHIKGGTSMGNSAMRSHVAAVVDGLLCGLVGKIVVRQEKNCTWLWAMNSTGRALGVACVI